MVFMGVKKSFRSLLIVGTWLGAAIIASKLILSERTTERNLAHSGNTIQSGRQIEEEPRNGTNPASKERNNHLIASTKNLPVKAKAVAYPKFYIKKYSVNCSAVFDDDAEEIKQVEIMLKEEKSKSRKKEILVPSDTEVAHYSDDCDFFRKARGYPTTVLSEEEKGFPLAFIILAHKNTAQVELLLRAIYQPHNVYALHPDMKSPPEFQRAIRNIARCFDNVFVCSKLEAIKYAGFTRLLADINCMKDLVNHSIRWKYVINQCGEAFPLKTNLEMVQQIKAYHGLNDAEGYEAPHKLARVHRFSPKYNAVSTVKERLKKFPPPGNITIRSGNAYNTLSRKFVEYVLSDQLPVQFLDWINMTYSPDEHYWASLQRVPSAPGSYPNITHKDINTSFVKWMGENSDKECIGQYIRGVCVMTTGYLPYVAKQPHLFANKFHYSHDPVTLQCLQELLTNRTQKPELKDVYFQEFPKKRDWY